MGNFNNSIGVSLLFKEVRGEALIDGIIRSFIIPTTHGYDELIKYSTNLATFYPNNELYIGIEDVFQVTHLVNTNSSSIYGKSYIEPINEIDATLLVSKRDLLENIESFQNSNEVLVSLVYYSKSSLLAITCLTKCSVNVVKEHLEGINYRSIFQSIEFMSLFINKKFDGVSSDEFEFIGIEQVFTFTDQVVNDALNFMSLTKENVSGIELDNLLLSKQDISNSLNECKDWLKCLNKTII